MEVKEYTYLPEIFAFKVKDDREQIAANLFSGHWLL
jgi:hypothetical protein